jgi:polar amino acid transport system substrate-binding protein
MTGFQIPNSTIVGRFPLESPPEHFSIVLQKGSPLTPCVNRAIGRLRADGTLAQLKQKLPFERNSPPTIQ